MAMARVAIVIPCFQHKRFLAGAIESALAQSTTAAEIIVVDDGSTDSPESVIINYPSVRLLRQSNRGLAAARNAGLYAATSDKIIFLDADDRLMPNAVAMGLRCFDCQPNCGFVYGAYLEMRRFRKTIRFQRASIRSDLVRSNRVGMIATVMFDRRQLVEIGGFDPSLSMCEDWDAYLRISRQSAFASHQEVVAQYLRHGRNMSNDTKRLRHWIKMVRQKEFNRGLSDEEQIAWDEGRQFIDAVNASPLRRVVRNLSRALRQPPDQSANEAKRSG